MNLHGTNSKLVCVNDRVQRQVFDKNGNLVYSGLKPNGLWYGRDRSWLDLENMYEEGDDIRSGYRHVYSIKLCNDPHSFVR
jgi:hypothetical protein